MSVPHAAYDWVVDATGSAQGLRSAAAMVRPRGTLILKSTVHTAVPIDTAPIIVNEITLVGSRCGRFEAALPWIANPAIRLEEMLAGEFPLSDAQHAFAAAAAHGTLKVLLTNS
jgi:alcohol dehydrogenase